jgi:hypothetical protein
MTTEIAHQLAASQRIAVFSAAVRGHELGEWYTDEGSAKARCVRCGAELRVYVPAIEPEMDGPALVHECAQRRVAAEAA